MKNIPAGVNKRLSRISSNKAVFDAAAPVYQEALNKSGYNHKLEFEPPTKDCTKKKRRKRNIIYFNPPYSANVRTNVGKEFLNLIDRFPADNPLKKLITRQTVKVSYCCMPSMAQAVARHNHKVLHSDQQPVRQPGCNCRGGPATCPVRKCGTDCVGYRATVTEEGTGSKETYTGVTANK